VLGEDAVEPTAVVPMAEFAEVEEVLATKTGLVFPPAPELTQSVVVERTQAAPTRIIDARSQPEGPAHVSLKPSPPSVAPAVASANVKLVALSAALGGAAVTLLIVLVAVLMTGRGTGPVQVPLEQAPSAATRGEATQPGGQTPNLSAQASPSAVLPIATPIASPPAHSAPAPRSAVPRPTRAPEQARPSDSARPPTSSPRASRLVELANALAASTQPRLSQDPAFKPFVDLVSASAARLPEGQRKIAMAQLDRLIDTGDVARVHAIVGILEGAK